jgi:hypothetical protein
MGWSGRASAPPAREAGKGGSPNDLAGVGIDRNELAGLFAGEQQAAAGRQHRRPNLEIHQRSLPFLLRGERIDGLHVADRLVCSPRERYW